MKTSFSPLTALLFAGAMHTQTVHAEGWKKGRGSGFTGPDPKSDAKKECAMRAEHATTAIR
jgi:hypothetical protein